MPLLKFRSVLLQHGSNALLVLAHAGLRTLCPCSQRLFVECWRRQKGMLNKLSEREISSPLFLHFSHKWEIKCCGSPIYGMET